MQDVITRDQGSTPLQETKKPFKVCSLCGKQWLTREEFLADRELKLNGYQWTKRKVIVGDPAKGLLLFTHENGTCGTTVAIWAGDFREPSERKSHPLNEARLVILYTIGRWFDAALSMVKALIRRQ